MNTPSQTQIDHWIQQNTRTYTYCTIGLDATHGCAYHDCEECEHSRNEEVEVI